MNIKKLDIKFPKQDYQTILVGVKENGELVQLGANDLMFFTVRDTVNIEKYAFQKSLNNGIAYDSDTKKYTITINSEDTENMDVSKEYGYDITIYFDRNKPKQQVVGKFILTNKYTLNEVL